jgi:glycosyltransferase involved in cell wall biosynthesis
VAHGWPDGPDGAGGTELYAAALHACMAARGLRVGRFTPGDVAGPRRRRGLSAHTGDPAVTSAFARVLAELRPDVVHVHHLSGLGLSLPRLARAAGARVVVTLHDDWLACARGQRMDLHLRRCEGPDLARCARCLAPDLWAPVPPLLAARLPPRTHAVRERLEALRALAASTDLFLSPSPHFTDRNGLRAELLPLPLLRPIRPAPPPTDGTLRVLFLGGLLPTKGPHVALEAFARLPRGAAELTLAGPALPFRGSLRWAHALRERARRTPGVRVAGLVRHDAVEPLLHAHDVLVFPSTWDENAPLVLREACAAGLGIVASDVPGARAHAPHAVFVPPGDPSALSEALARAARAPRVRMPAPVVPSLDAHVDALLARYGALVG